MPAATRGIMDKQFILEMIGYTGSLLVIVSMLMTSVVKLRVINTIGGVIFCGYALCIHSYPTAAMQVCLIVINLINLYKLNNTKKEYTAVDVKADDGFLTHFLFANSEDIKKYFPDFAQPAETDKIFLITCGEVPAGRTSSDNMPIGMQFAGAMFSEKKILRLAQNWESEHSGCGIAVKE